MKDLPRLRDERGSALEHALLGAGSSPVASRETRAKTMAALGLAGSATLIAGAATAGPLTSLVKLGWAKLIIGVSLAGAAAAVPAGYYYVRHHAVVAPAHRAERDVTAPTVVTPPAAVVAVQDQSADPPANPPAARAAVPSHPAFRAGASLVHELAALDAARATLTAGDARSALALLDIYDDRFPRGHLELEAEVLRIDALAKSGRRQAARQRAEAFLRRHPQSVLAARVRADAHLGD